MTREEWEQVLFEHVHDEVAQDTLNEYVLELESKNAELMELACDASKAAHMLCVAWEGSCDKEAEGMSLHAVCPIGDTSELCVFGKLHDRVRELGIEAEA